MSKLTPEERQRLNLALSRLNSKDPAVRAKAVDAVNDQITLQLRKSSLLVSLDEGKTWQPAEQGVRITYQDLELDENDGRVLLNCTHEGLVVDIMDEDEVLGTSSETYAEIAQRLTAKGANHATDSQSG